MKKRLLCLALVVALALSMMGTALAANYTTDYSGFSTPDSSDYAYWNGSRMVRNSGTTTSEVKWMQASINWCVQNKGLNASLLDVDGSFGPATQSATRAFQTKYSLSVDGSFGPATIAKMKEVLAEVVIQNSPSKDVAKLESLLFHSAIYYNLYPDLQAAFGYNESSLKNHYYPHGKSEGRIASPIFDPEWYLNHNGDVAETFGAQNWAAAYDHFLNYGFWEHRQGSAWFSADTYLSNYGDLRSAFGDDIVSAAWHFMVAGISEGRVAAPDGTTFDASLLTPKATQSPETPTPTPTPTPAPTTASYSGTADDVINYALSKKGWMAKDFGFTADWCGYFVSQMGREAGANFPSNGAGGRVIHAARWFVNNNAGTLYYFEDSTLDILRTHDGSLNTSGLSRCVKANRSSFAPQKGDIFVVHKYVDEWGFDHIGFVTGYSGGKIQTVEGNTGSASGSPYYEYSKVGTDNRPFTSADSRGRTIQAIIRPDYSGTISPVITPEPTILTPTPAPASDTGHDVDYGKYTMPSGSDFAYWSGSKSVKASQTTADEIKWMQAALNYCIANKGLSASYLDVDGSFGPATKATTQAFQSKYGLSVDGSFGPATLAKMKEVLDFTVPETSGQRDWNAAYQYAKTYWNTRDSSYTYYSGNNCANFVSACLHAGGVPFSEEWTDKSYAFINCSGLKNYFRNNYGIAYYSYPSAASISAGDVIYTNNGGHVMLCMGKNAAGQVLASGNTNNRDCIVLGSFYGVLKTSTLF